jgi:hypothetical protein
VATATDPQSFLSRRPALLCWNVLEVDDEQPLFVFALIHWWPLEMRQKTYLDPRTKYEASRCPGSHFLHCLKYCAQTSLYQKCIISTNHLYELLLTGSFVKAVLQMWALFTVLNNFRFSYAKQKALMVLLNIQTIPICIYISFKAEPYEISPQNQ